MKGKKKIKAGDRDALPKLHERLKKRQWELKLMQSGNKALRRKTKESQIAYLSDSGWEPKVAKLFVRKAEPYSATEIRKQYTLIQQDKDRIETILNARNRGYKQAPVCPGVTYFEDPADMRLGFLFDKAAMPEKLINYMRKRGFVYKMTAGAWQRTLTEDARRESRNNRLFLRRLYQQENEND